MATTDTQPDKTPQKEQDPPRDTPEDLLHGGGCLTHTPAGNIQCLSVIGQIEGHYAAGEGQKATKYEHVIPLLCAIDEDSRIDGLLILLHTMGGDVEAGLAIAELIASMHKPTVSLVLGGGHSIGVPLAVSARKSFIVPSATMTIHPVRTTGTTLGVPQAFRYLSEMQDRITRFVCTHSRVSETTLWELMMRPDQLATDVGSVIEGAEAVRIGLIDCVGGLSDAEEALYAMIREEKGNRRVSNEPIPAPTH